MKQYTKAKKDRKPFKMKKGGGTFRFSGGRKYSSVTSYGSPESSGASLLGSLLMAMGFSVGKRGR